MLLDIKKIIITANIFLQRARGDKNKAISECNKFKAESNKKYIWDAVINEINLL